jgi:hypothetical protein
MSEYQHIAFRAIDGPVSDKNLKYMRQQSSRAEITAWSFELAAKPVAWCEYEYTTATSSRANFSARPQ